MWTLIAIVVASLFEIIPTFVIKSNVVTIDTVEPYTPLELYGRDIYVAEGCYNCHSQMVRPIHPETERYGTFSKGGEFVYDHPFQWGSRRIGPDLHRVGGKYSDTWHIRHFIEPKSVTVGSIMPPYTHLVEREIDWEVIRPRMRAMQILGVPYTDEEVAKSGDAARAQAQAMLEAIIAADGPGAVPENIATRDAIALTAYLQRLGTDIFKTPVEEPPADDAEAETVAALTEGAAR
jgi:cytochrome c oxidase cbb3-type subunit I/II